MNQVASKPVLKEGAGGSNGLEEESESKGADIPEDWKEKCPKDEAWCDTFLGKIIKEGKQKELFGDVQPRKLTPKEKKIPQGACSEIKDYHKKKTCIKVKTLEIQLWNNRDKLGKQREGKIDADAKGFLAVWLLVGGLLLCLLIGGILLYAYLSNNKKDGGGTKGGKLKSRRSKSGKSTLAKSGRKSRASKISHQSKKTSKNLGSKKSVNPK